MGCPPWGCGLLQFLLFHHLFASICSSLSFCLLWQHWEKKHLPFLLFILHSARSAHSVAPLLLSVGINKNRSEHPLQHPPVLVLWGSVGSRTFVGFCFRGKTSVGFPSTAPWWEPPPVCGLGVLSCSLEEAQQDLMLKSCRLGCWAAQTQRISLLCFIQDFRSSQGLHK